MSAIVNFGHLSLADKTLAESLKLKPNYHSYWYYLRFSLYQRSKLALIQRFLIQQLIHKFPEAEKVLVFGSTKDSIMGIDREVDFIPKRKNTTPIKRTGSLIQKLYYLFNYSILFLFRSIWGGFLNPIRKVKNSSKLIITNTYNQQTIFDLKTADLIEGDPHLHYLLERTIHDNNINYLSQIKPLSLENTHQFNIKNYFKRNQFSKKTIYFEPFLFQSLFSLSFYKNYKQLRQRWKAASKALSAKHLSIEDKIILKTFNSLSKLLLLAAWREHAAFSMGKYMKLKKVVAIDEHGLQNQSIFNALKQQHIKTIAIQHGAISNSNMAYKFSQLDRHHKPFPDLTLIRGKFTEEMLLAQCYPKNQLKIVGHIRTDAIAAIQSADFKLGLFPTSKNQALIVYATQPIPAQEQSLKKKLAADFFKLCHDFPQYNFVLKPHPNEKSLELYQQYAKHLKHANFQFYEGNLYQLLAKSSLVITYFSTVGIEAIYFNKPLLTIDYFQVDAQAYLKDGVSLNATNYKELKKYVNQIITSGTTVSNSKINAFIENRVYKIDGRVAERCYELI